MAGVLRGLLVAGVAVLGMAAPAWADEVEDAAKEALDLYKKGDLGGAAGQLDYAAQLIRQQKAAGIEKLLPAAPAGWTAEKGESQAAAAALFGGGVTAERRYTKGDADMTLSIVTDSPMLQGMAAMFTNPAVMASSGAKLEKVGGQKAFLQYDAEAKSGEATMIVDNRMMVTVRGNGATREEILGLLAALDVARLAKA